MSDSKDIALKIDDRDVSVPPGTLVIEAARRMGIEVPSFCYFPGLSLQAACRMCLVEVEKAPKLQTACTLVATPGMVVRTNTPQVLEARKGMLEFLLANHPLDCPVCDKGGECELQDMVFAVSASVTRVWMSRRSALASAARNPSLFQTAKIIWTAKNAACASIYALWAR